MGRTFHIYEHTGQQCSVHAYSSNYKPRVVQIAHGGTAYDHPGGTTYILDINHGFDMTADQEPSLLNPNQLRSNNLTVDDCPTHLSYQHSSTHSIYVPENDLTIPLELDGVISFVATRLPSMEEIRNCEHVTLTSVVEWDPHSQDFNHQEKVVKTNASRISSVSTNDSISSFSSNIPPQVLSESDVVLQDISSSLNEERFLSMIESAVRVTINDPSSEVHSISATTSKPRTSSRNANHLSKVWGIGLNTAEEHYGLLRNGGQG